MRKANVNDCFNFARMISELGLKEELFKAQHNQEDLEKIGFDMIFNVLEKATTKVAQEKIYKVLSEPFEIETEEVGLMSIDELVKSFNECFNMSTLANFIKRVGN